jgi:hypothetical protein
MSAEERNADRWVLGLISGGLILILLGILLGLFLTPRALPNWAENVLVSIATASALKLGDCLATLVALASGRQVERMGTQLAASAPLGTAPDGAVDVNVVNPPDDPANVQEQQP